MNILVLAHELGVGGSQRNAVDLARTFGERGHVVTIAGPDGPLGTEIKASGLGYVPLWVGRLRPSPRRGRQVRRVIEETRPDVVHAYEWPAALEAAVALRGNMTAALITTVLSMEVAPEVPRRYPLLVGTPAIRDAVMPQWQAPVGLCEPPVDLANDRWDPDRAYKFRREHGIDADTFLAVIVSRVARRMKFEGIQLAIEAVVRRAEFADLQLAIVGDGDAMPDLARLVAEVNAGRTRPLVVLAGEQPDPRGAYAAADVVLGMGGSALRGLAHARPLVVLGEDGFVQLCDPSTVESFTYGGFYGRGSVTADPVGFLATELAALARAPRRRIELGRFGRELVASRYALDVVADGVEQAYRDVVRAPTRLSWRDMARTHAAAAAREVRLHVPSVGRLGTGS